MTAVDFADVTLRLGGRTVLTEASFTIGCGEFIGVLGPNGAGKTTLMRAILGLLRPSKGAIQILGRPAGDDNRAVGYLPQQRSVTAGLALRGWDFVACAAAGAGWGLPLRRAGERRKIDSAIAKVGATKLAERPLAELSGGERQRLLLAQALLGEPRLLLLDEPLLNLDPHHQSAVVKLVRELQRESGMTVLFSAHELNPLLGALDRVLYLGHGQAVLGAVEEVIRGDVLSRLYGAPIDVVRIGGRVFVMSGEYSVEHVAHLHEEHDHHV